MHTPENRPSIDQQETVEVRGSRTHSIGRLFRGVLAATVLAGAPAREADAQDASPVGIKAMRQEVDGVQEQLRQYDELRKQVDDATVRLREAGAYDPELALAITRMRIKLNAHGAAIGRAQRRSEEVERTFERVEALMAEGEKKELQFYTNVAADFAGNTFLWSRFVENAKQVFARYEKVRETASPSTEQKVLLEEMARAVKLYRKPEGPHDREALGAALTALARMERAMESFEEESSGALRLTIADGGTIAFRTDDGRESPAFTVDGSQYDVYPFGAAVLERRGEEWVLIPDASFRGTVTVTGGGESRTYRVPAGSEEQNPKAERAGSAEEPRPTPQTRTGPKTIEPGRPFVKASVQYEAIKRRHAETLLADRAAKGGSVEWQAFHHEYEQAFLDMLALFGGNHPDDIDGGDWYGMGAWTRRVQPMLDRMNATLDRYEAERAKIPEGSPEKTQVASIDGIDLAATVAGIEDRAERMKKENGGKLPESYAGIDAAYRAVYEKVLREEPLNARLIALTLANWEMACAAHADAPVPSTVQNGLFGGLSLGGIMNNVANGAGYAGIKDTLALRRRIIADASKRAFEMRKTPEVLEALLRFQEAMPDMLGSDGELLKGDIAVRAIKVLERHGEQLRSVNPEGEERLATLSRLVGKEIDSGMIGGINGRAIDWLIAAFNAPVAPTGLPDGIMIDIREADADEEAGAQ